MGEAKAVSGELLVGCSIGAVVLSRVQPAGKKEMSGADWFRGLREESILIS
jgi:methionyl-tRNA formyltransferase